jgi:ParB/RepB/Spo0J family partition protein
MAEILRANIRAALDVKGMSMSKAARAAGLFDHSPLSKFMSGKSQRMDVATLVGLAAALETQPGRLMGLTAETVTGLSFVPHDAIRPNALNPRRKFDMETDLELRASIKEEGLLSPIKLWHEKSADGIDIYTLAYGERRWRAIGALIKEGYWSPLERIPAIVAPRPDRESEIITLLTENMQRQDVNPLEEGDAMAAYLQAHGGTAKDLALRLGKNPLYVQRRVALSAKLCEAGREALDEGRITIQAARALVRAPKEMQEEALECADGSELRDEKAMMGRLTAGRIPVSRAIFDVKEYKGAFIGEGGDRWFTDSGQFERLQRRAVREKQGELKRQWADCEVIEDYAFYRGEFEDCADRSRGIAVIFIDRVSLGVDVHEGLVRRAGAGTGKVHKPQARSPQGGELPFSTPQEAVRQADEDRQRAEEEADRIERAALARAHVEAEAKEQIAAFPYNSAAAFLASFIDSTWFWEVAQRADQPVWMLPQIELASFFPYHKGAPALQKAVPLLGEAIAKECFTEEMREAVIDQLFALDEPSVMRLFGQVMADLVQIVFTSGGPHRLPHIDFIILNHLGVTVPDEIQPLPETEKEPAA